MDQPIHWLPYTAETVHDWIVQLWSSRQDWGEYDEAMLSALTSDKTDLSQAPSLPFLLLPGLCCQAAGGDSHQALGVAAAWSLLYTAAHALDEIEDGDRQVSSSSPINVTTGLIFTGVRALLESKTIDIPDSARLDIIRDFVDTILQMCAGQHRDLTITDPPLEQCWDIARAKSGGWFALACRAGARLAKPPDQVVDCYSQLGYNMGMLVQIGDDCRGLQTTSDGRSDLATGKHTLPVAYALTVTPPEIRNQLLDCLQAAREDVDAETGARALIIRTGALPYLAVEARRYFQRAEQALLAANALAPSKDHLLVFLNQFAPF